MIPNAAKFYDCIGKTETGKMFSMSGHLPFSDVIKDWNAR